MHISEGILSLPVLAAGYVCSAMGVGMGLKKLKEEDMVRTAIFSSAYLIPSTHSFLMQIFLDSWKRSLAFS